MKAKTNKVVQEKKASNVTVDEAIKLIQEAEQKKREACWNDILETAKKHKFNLGINYIFTLTPVAE